MHSKINSHGSSYLFIHDIQSISLEQLKPIGISGRFNTYIILVSCRETLFSSKNGKWEINGYVKTTTQPLSFLGFIYQGLNNNDVFLIDICMSVCTTVYGVEVWTLTIFCHSEVDLLVCLGSLSCCMTQFCPSLSYGTIGLTFVSRIFTYKVDFNVVSMTTRHVA